MRIAKHQQHTATAEVAQRNGLALKVGQEEVGRWRAGLQAIPLDMAFAQRPLVLQAAAFLLGFNKFGRTRNPPGKGENLIRSTRERRRHSRLLVHKVGNRRASLRKRLRGWPVPQK